MSWSSEFLTPIDAPERKLRTLADARDYVLSLPEDEQQKGHWQVAAETLLEAAEYGGQIWLMFARIGMMTALDGGDKGRPEPSERSLRPDWSAMKMGLG